VIPGAFAYHRPKSVNEAVAMLADLGEDARALAGGHSLIPMMKLRLAAPEHLIDLAGIADLEGIRQEGGDIVIGAMTTQRELIARAHARQGASQVSSGGSWEYGQSSSRHEGQRQGDRGPGRAAYPAHSLSARATGPHRSAYWL
jgi:FAD binding domain in molybdopterin dehydrogenase